MLLGSIVPLPASEQVFDQSIWVLMRDISFFQNCLKAMGKTFHPECFVCAYCGKIFANSPFYLEDGLPYCEEGKIPSPNASTTL